MDSKLKNIHFLIVEKSNRNPISANGTPLEVTGDVSCQFEIENDLYDEKFTLITNLCYTVILGNDLLQKLGFYIDPGGTKIRIAGKIIRRVYENDYNNCITT